MTVIMAPNKAMQVTKVFFADSIGLQLIVRRDLHLLRADVSPQHRRCGARKNATPGRPRSVGTYDSSVT